MGVVDDVQDRLQAQGIVDGATGWPSVRRREHDGSDRLVRIIEDGGPSPEFPADSGLGDAAIEDPGVQVMVRGTKTDGGDAVVAKATEIKNDLHGLQAVTLNGTLYHRIRAMTPDPISIPEDGRGRPLATIAFRLMRDA